MKRLFSSRLVIPLGVGALIAYFADPASGGRRRSLLRGKSLRMIHASRNLIRAAARDFLHRGQGLVARTRAGLLPSGASGPIIAQRVRSVLGRHVSHPHSIEITAEGGNVILSGVILADELEPLLRALTHVPGVVSFENRLETHRKSGHVPGLQGGVRRPGDGANIYRQRWAPSTRVLVGTAGAWLSWRGLKRGGAFGGTLLLGGGVFLVRALMNTGMGAIVGVGERKAVSIHKTLNVDAPIEMVYLFWSNFENFSRLLTHVREVRVSSSGLVSHWTVDGPAGVPLHWDAQLTRIEPNRVIAWRSMPGAVIPNAGRIRFRRGERGRTRVDLDLSYDPPAGVLGSLAARIFGADPKSRFEEALYQIKTFLEQGPSERQARGLH